MQLLGLLNASTIHTRVRSSTKNLKPFEAAQPFQNSHLSGPEWGGVDTSLLSNALQVVRVLHKSFDDQVAKKDLQVIADLRSFSQTLQAIFDQQHQRGNLNDPLLLVIVI